MMLTLEPGTKVHMSKLPAVGGNGGSPFDSGCNPSGVKKVRIECGFIFLKRTFYLSSIKRLWLDFNIPQPDPNGDHGVFHGYFLNPSLYNKVFTFGLDPNDQIVKIVVWSDGILANAVQFHTEIGLISPMYGIPLPTSIATEFQGEYGSTLAGVHGRFGNFIDKLGFSFATLRYSPCAVCTSSRVLDTTSKDKETASIMSMNNVITDQN